MLWGSVVSFNKMTADAIFHHAFSHSARTEMSCLIRRSEPYWSLDMVHLSPAVTRSLLYLVWLRLGWPLSTYLFFIHSTNCSWVSALCQAWFEVLALQRWLRCSPHLQGVCGVHRLVAETDAQVDHWTMVCLVLWELGEGQAADLCLGNQGRLPLWSGAWGGSG